MIQPDFIPKVNIDEYHYELPKDRIAEYPLEDRSASKLLYADVKTKKITHHKFYELAELLRSDTLLVMNTTKVIPARIFLKKPTGGIIELLLVEPANFNLNEIAVNKVSKNSDPQIALLSKGESCWLCIVGGKRVKEKMLLKENYGDDFTITAEILSRRENEAIVKFRWLPDNITFSEMLLKTGKVPLPPYINRDVRLEDKKWYQTVYAKADGSVAAPTAGFHFTDEILNQLKNKNIITENIVLHVGPGTFTPIDVDDVFRHEMHSERISISLDSINNIIKYLRNNETKGLIAVGTTTLRTLESLYWIGCKILFNIYNENDIFTLNQWDSYEIEAKYELPDSLESLKSIINFLTEKNQTEITAKTSLFIIPGYKFKIVNGLITNYHLPKSTLILLVAAFTGKELWREIYSSALNNNYRFLSYGDSSLITNY